MTSRRVAFVVGSLGTGGAERFVSTAVTALQHRGHSAAVALFRDELVYPIPEETTVEVLRKARTIDNPGAILRLARFIRSWRPDVVISAWSYPNFFTRAALTLVRHPPSWIARASSNPTKVEGGLLKHLGQAVYRRADAVIANSADLLNAVSARYGLEPARTQVVRNPVDWAYVDDAARETPAFPLPTRPGPVIVTMSRLHKEKRPDLIIGAFSRLLDIHPDCHLLWIGDGPEREALQDQIRSAGLADRCQITGFLAKPHGIVARSDLFVLASDGEGCPNSLIEAQGLGRAAVSTDCDFGPREIIRHGETGLLVPRGDQEAITQALSSLIEHPHRANAFGGAAMTRMRRLFSADTVIPTLEDVIEDVVAARKPDRLLPRRAPVA